MMKIIMTTLFGIEAVTAEELSELGYERHQMTIQDGQVQLDVGQEQEKIAMAVARCNTFLATAERVLLQLANFPAKDFDSLFDQVADLPWEEWLPAGPAILVKGYSRKSALYGIPACQRLIKKAIIRRLLKTNRLPDDADWPEDADRGQWRVQFGIVNDQVSIMMDTSGDGLHKRGYRPLLHEAPIKETLAAAMLRIARYRPNTEEALLDPCCGSGTILIEAAMLAAKKAPGSNRSFAAESWPFVGPAAFEKARKEARSQELAFRPGPVRIYGSDIAARAVSVARSNADRVGLSRWISLQQQNLYDLDEAKIKEWTEHERILMICNPPYGERLLDQDQAEDMIRQLGNLCLDRGQAKKSFRLAVISPHEQFEKLIGFPADKRRKLYNGMIRCTYYQYFKYRRTDR